MVDTAESFLLIMLIAAGLFGLAYLLFWCRGRTRKTEEEKQTKTS